MSIAIARRRPPSELVPTQEVYRAVRHFEGFVPYAYDDAVNPNKRKPIMPGDVVHGTLTIGYGFTKNVKPGDTMTVAQAETRLVHEVERHAAIVPRYVKVPLTQGEFDALTVYAFNYGHIKPSLCACLNGGTTDKGEKVGPQDYEGAVEQILRAQWGKVRWSAHHFLDGVARTIKSPMGGLRRRRMAESLIFKGLPWENACSPNAFKTLQEVYPIDGNNYACRVVPEESTQWEDVLQRALRDAASTPEPVYDDIFEDPPEEAPKPPHCDPVPEATREAEKVEEPPAPTPSPPAGTKPAPQIAEAKDMVQSKRFWGHMLTAFGTLNFIPEAWRSWFNEGSNRELLIWVIVIGVGYALHRYGVFKATKALK